MGMITYAFLKERPKEFLAVTSLDHTEFLLLLPVFSELYHAPLIEKTATGQTRLRQPGAGAKGQLATIEDKLLFILAYQKTYPLQTLLGLHFGLRQPQTNYWIHRLVPVLQMALQQMGHTPERDPEKVADYLGPDQVSYALLIDGTDDRWYRTASAASQGPFGAKRLLQREKKVHSYKNLIVGDRPRGKVLYLGETTPGKVHDKKRADQEQILYPLGALLSQDTGSQGYAPFGVMVEQPKKKPRGRELSAGEKFLNSVLSSLRVAIEHCLCGIKRCRIVKDVLRNTKEGLADIVMEIACALHNLRREARQQPCHLNLLDRAALTYS